jgi:hypothetical protein
MRYGEHHTEKDTLIVGTGETIVGGAGVWVDEDGLAAAQAADGIAGTTLFGVASHDAAEGEALMVVKHGIVLCKATNSQTIGIGALVTCVTTTGLWSATSAAAIANGRARSATSGGSGEFFEVDLFDAPYLMP